MTEDDIRRMMAQPPGRPSEDSWEHGPDAVRDAGDPSARVAVEVSLVFGDQAELITPHHTAAAPLRVPAAELARQLGVNLAELPSTRFTAVIDGDVVTDARLAG